jgi:hypothetical protein
MVVARQKQKSVALRSEFIVLLDGVDFIDCFLDRGRRSGWTKNQNIRSEIRPVRAGGHSREQSIGQQSDSDAHLRHAMVPRHGKVLFAGWKDGSGSRRPSSAPRAHQT